MAFLSVTAINVAQIVLRKRFPDLCTRITLPEHSVENRTCRAIRIRAGDATDRCGVLLTGGVHARELVNPDGLISWAFDICEAYTNGTGVTYGNITFSAEIVKSLLESLDIFIVPLVNPDGRAFVLNPDGDAFWRKNRADNGPDTCQGVDLNRNCDLLFDSGIGSSSDPCSDIFRGPSAFSEPETRNIKALLDDNPNICCYMDVHSFSELVIFPWGDDEVQTDDPDMNFRNPDFDDVRGTAGDADYREFMPADDLDFYQSIAGGIRNAIEGVRGRTYTVGPSFTTLYPTSGTIKDFCYSRHFVDTGLRKIRAFLMETGTEFQPGDEEAAAVIQEIGAAATQLCFGCFCVAEALNANFKLRLPLDPIRRFRDQVLAKTSRGRRYKRLYETHGMELMVRALKDAEFRKAAVGIMEAGARIAEADPAKTTVDRDTLKAVSRLMDMAAKGASPALAKAIESVRGDLAIFEKHPIAEALARAGDDDKPSSKKKS